MIKKKLDYERAAEEAMAGWARSQDLVFEAFAARTEAVQHLRDVEEAYMAAGVREHDLQRKTEQNTAYIRDLEYRLLALSELHETAGNGDCSYCFTAVPCPTMKIVTGL